MGEEYFWQREQHGHIVLSGSELGTLKAPKTERMGRGWVGRGRNREQAGARSCRALWTTVRIWISF